MLECRASRQQCHQQAQLCTRFGQFQLNLKNYTQKTEINKIKINDIDKYFSIMREHGYKVIFRVVYDSEGTKNPENCKFTVYVDSITILDAVEIIPCTDEAIKSIEEVKVWKC